MRRPITLVFASLIGGIFLGYNLGLWLVMPLIAIFCLAACLFAKRRDKLLILVLLVITVLGFTYISVLENRQSPFENCEGRVIDVKGKVISIEDKDNYLRLLLKCSRWKMEDKLVISKEKIIVNLALPGDEAGMDKDGIANYQSELIGSTVSIKGRLTLPSRARNPGLFDYRLYLKSKGISAIIGANQSNLESIESGDIFTDFLTIIPWKFKSKFSSSIDSYIDAEAKALLMGILFGDKTLIDEDIYENFQKNGCAHILSVSGLHVGIIYIYISRIFSNHRGIISTVTILLILLFYAALAAFSPSVMRAVSMIAIHLLSKHLHRRYDLLCCLSFSAIIMLVWNPYYLFNTGFQLSYLAVLSLAFGLPCINRLTKKIEDKYDSRFLKTIFATITPIFVIQGAMAPITAFHFCYISFSSFIINVPIIAISGILVPAGVGVALLCLLWDTNPLIGPCATIVEYMLKTMIELNALAGEFPLSSINIKAPSVFAIVVFYGSYFFLTSECFRMLKQVGKKATASLVMVIVLIMGLFAPLLTNESFGKAEVVFVDVGQGDCVHLRTPGGKNILIDGGGSRDYDVGKKVLMPYFLKNGVDKIDLALVTHLHQDHYGGIASLCKLMKVKKMAVYEGNILRKERLLKDTGLKEGDFLYVGLGDRLAIEKDIYIDILYPQRQTGETYEIIMAENEDENLSSLVMTISYNGINILITGDMGFTGEAMLMNQPEDKVKIPLKSHVLKVGHHGSRFSTGDDFLDETDPEIAIIQVGKNNFGHPHPDVIEKLDERGIITFRNDESGAIFIDIKPRGLKIRTML